MWVPATSNRSSDHHSREFLTNDSNFPYSSKNSSVEHIHAFLYISLCAWVLVCVSVTVCEYACVCMCVCVCVRLWEWVSVFVMISHVDKAWICSAEEFLELCGKVEAVVRNCLLRWSGHLVEVVGIPLFDQCFCFKHISLFYAPVGAFFRWYPPFVCYTKDFTCRSGVNLNLYLSNESKFWEIKKCF